MVLADKYFGLELRTANNQYLKSSNILAVEDILVANQSIVN